MLPAHEYSCGGLRTLVLAREGFGEGTMNGDKKIHLGTSGWKHDDWRGVLFPTSCKDELAAYARRFDTVEIDSTGTTRRRAALSNRGATASAKAFASAPKCRAQSRTMPRSSTAKSRFMSLSKPCGIWAKRLGRCCFSFRRGGLA